ncbi:MAG: hypothetical protein ABIT38_17260 [Gemmatimonadaceae bacterium]
MPRAPNAKSDALVVLLALFASLSIAACGRGGEAPKTVESVATKVAASDSSPTETEPDTIAPSDTGSGAYDARSAAAIGFWRLTGTEPFWGVRIDTGGIVFSSPDLPNGMRFPIAVPVVADGSLRFNSTMERAPVHDIEVVLTEKSCSDGMSDKSWTYAAHVMLDKQRYEGCAERFAAPTDMPAH